MKGEWFALKTMKKSLLVKSKKWEKRKQNIFAERNILSMIKHPFICNSYCNPYNNSIDAFQDEFNLYLVMDLAFGGDLRYQVRFIAISSYLKLRVAFLKRKVNFILHS